MNPRRVLVTGAGGFVGTHLVRFLEAKGDTTVFGTLHAPRGATGEAELARPTTTRFVGDLVDQDFAGAVVRETRPDWVFHLAAQPSVAESWKDPAGTIVNNTLAELRILEGVATYASTARVLVVGSSEEYGRGTTDDDVASESSPLQPVSPYATSKVAQDILGLQYYLGRGVDVVRVRPFNLFGPGQSDRFAVASFARQIVEVELGRRAPTIDVGNLAARRDYTDVRDAVEAYRLLLERGRSGEVYNVGGGGVRAIGEILSLLIQLARCSVTVRTDPNRFRPIDALAVGPDTRRIQSEMGWRPVIKFEQTVQDVLDDWRVRLADLEGG